MSIDIGAQIMAIVQRSIIYQDTTDPQNPVTKTMYLRDVTMQIVGLPAAVQPPPTFVVAVNDATQWDQLQVGKTVTVKIEVPAP